MKSSTLSSLALSTSILATGISGCENPTIRGEKAVTNNQAANIQLNTAREQIHECARVKDQENRAICWEAAKTIRTNAFMQAGLSPETERADITCSGEDPCAITYSVREDLCRLPVCQIKRVNNIISGF